MGDACYTIYPSPAHDGKKVGFSFPMIFRFSSSSRSLFSFSSRSSFSSSSRMSHHCQFRWSSTRSDLPLNISVNRSLNIRQYSWPAQQCTLYCWTELVHSSAPGVLVHWWLLTWFCEADGWGDASGGTLCALLALLRAPFPSLNNCTLRFRLHCTLSKTKTGFNMSHSPGCVHLARKEVLWPYRSSNISCQIMANFRNFSRTGLNHHRK